MIPLIMAGAALAGGAGGMLSGMSGAGQVNKNIGNATSAINDVKSRIPGQSAELVSGLNAAYSPYTQNAGQDMGAYRDMVNNMGGLSYAENDPFAYDMQSGMQQFLDPTMDAQIKSATDAVQGSAANRGSLFSSATGKGISDRAQEISRQSMKEAMQMALQDRGFQYGVHGDDISRDRQAVDFQSSQQGQRLDALGNLSGMGMSAVTNLADQTTGIKQGEFGSLNDADLKIADLMMGKQDSSWQGNLGNAITGAVGGLGAVGSFSQPKAK